MKQETLILLLFAVIGLEAFDLECEIREKERGFLKPGSVCRGQNVDITSRDQIVTSVNGKDSFNGSHIEAIKIENSNVNFIPRGLGKFFPDLEYLEVENSSLKELEKRDLAQFPNLKVLLLPNNEIKVLHSDVFKATPKLAHISFERNKISHIGYDILTNMIKLQSVKFDFNECTSAGAHSISGVRDLKDWWIAQCDEPESISVPASTETPESDRIAELELKVKSLEGIIETLSRQLLSLYPKSENFKNPPVVDVKCQSSSKVCEVSDFVVELPGSKIGKILNENGIEMVENVKDIEKLKIVDQKSMFLPSNFGEKFAHVTEFSIDRSSFLLLDSKTFANLNSLTSLTITENQVREVPENSFADKEKLIFLNLAGNRIEFINDKAFVGLRNLLELNLARNLLSCVNSEFFVNLASLHTLQLQQNYLKSIGSDIFSGLPKLSHLDISNNKLEKLSADIFSRDNKVSIFRAASNQLNFIDPKIVKTLKKAEMIDFSKNNCTNVIFDSSTESNNDARAFHNQIDFECNANED